MLQQKIQEYVQAHGLAEPGDTILLAVSGGLDSMALLEVFHRLAPALRVHLHVVHLNHQFRGAEAAGDAEFVKSQASARGIPATILTFDVPAYRDRHRLSSQDAAHRVRFGLFLQVARRVKADKLAVAHHRDDQVETVLMNLLRGTGPEGLRGMEPRRPWVRKEGLSLIRPLLCLSRQEIEHFLEEEGIPHRLDKSNLQEVYLRNKVRLQLLPLLEREYNPAFREALLSLSALMAEVEGYLGGKTRQALRRVLAARAPGRVTLNRERLQREPAALQGRLLRLCLAGLVPSPRELGSRHIRCLQQMAAAGRTGTSLDLPGGVAARVSYRELFLFRKRGGRAPGEQWGPVPLRVPGETDLPGMNVRVTARVLTRQEMPWPPREEEEALLDYEVLGSPALLQVRSRCPGDRLQPLGLRGSKKLKDFLIDRKVPREERDRLPLVAADGEILWVAGWTIADRCKITGETGRVLHLKVESIENLRDGNK